MEVVQTSLIGSILSNLLLVLGLSFFLGALGGWWNLKDAKGNLPRDLNENQPEEPRKFIDWLEWQVKPPRDPLEVLDELKHQSEEARLLLQRLEDPSIPSNERRLTLSEEEALRDRISKADEASKLNQADLTRKMDSYTKVMGKVLETGGHYRRIAKLRMQGKEQTFNQEAAQTSGSLLAIAVASMIVPTAFQISADSTEHIAIISRLIAVLCLCVYIGFLIFQLGTHTSLFDDPPRKTAFDVSGGDDEPNLNHWFAFVVLFVAAGITGVCANWLVDGIPELVETGYLTEQFAGLILLPIAGNAAEHWSAVTAAWGDKMNLSMQIAVGSSIQVSLFIFPFMVIAGWILHNEDMTLSLGGFHVAFVFVSVILVNYCIVDGESHYLEGLMLIVLYM